MRNDQNAAQTSSESREIPRDFSLVLTLIRSRQVAILALDEHSPLWMDLLAAIQHSWVAPVEWQWECELVHVNRCYFERGGLEVTQGPWKTLRLISEAWEELLIDELSCEVVCRIRPMGASSEP